MPKLSAEAKLFGMDLKHLGAELRNTWRQLGAALRVDRWLPASVVHVVSVANRQGYAKVRGAHWLGAVQDMAASGYTSSKRHEKLASIFLLNEQYFLLKSLVFPAMPASALEAAVRLELQAASPFDSAQTLFSYRVQREAAGDRPAQGTLQHVSLVITSVSLVRAALDASGIKHASELEIWADVPEQPPVLVKGFAESARLRQEKRKNQMLVIGSACLLGLLLLLAMTPTLQLRLRAIDAYQQYQTLVVRTQEQVQQRQQLLAAIQTLDAFSQKESAQINHMLVVKTLTEILPNDVALQSLSVEGAHLALQGVGDNASAVVELLAKTPGFKEVRLPAAVTRVPLLSKENFSLAAELDTTVFGQHFVDRTKEQP